MTSKRTSIITLFLCFLSIFVSAQSITLSISGDFVIPDIPKITQKGDTLLSSSPIGNQWFRNGIELTGENKQTILMKNSGNYKVSVTLGSGCSAESTTFSAIKTDVSIINATDFRCIVYPNPSDGVFTVQLESDHVGEYCLDLYDSSSRSVMKNIFIHLGGIQSNKFGNNELINGVYFLEIKFGSRYISHKIIINHRE